MATVHEMDHPLIKHKLALMRDKTTGVKEFREGKACSPQELDAFYLRRPQAERERMARLA